MTQEDLTSNWKVAMGPVWLDGKPALHVVDCDKRFQNAGFIRGKTSLELLSQLVEIWTSAYSGHPDILRVDQETSCIAKELIQGADSSAVVVHASDIEAHNTLGVGERYHHPLRRVYAAVQNSNHVINGPLALRLEIMALNDTMGPEGLVPSLLVLRQLH